MDGVNTEYCRSCRKDNALVTFALSDSGRIINYVRK